MKTRSTPATGCQYDAAYGGSPAEFYRAFLDDRLHAHGLTRAKVTGWRP